MSISTQVLPFRPREAPAYFSANSNRSGLTLNGVVAFLLGASLVAAGFTAGRFEVGGMLVQPYLVIAALMFLPLAALRLRTIPVRLVLGLTAFGAVYFASTFVGGVGVAHGTKAAAAVVTILTMAMLVRSKQDFVAGALGMTLAVGSLAVRGLKTDITGGLEAIESANRNAYSLYALPCVLLSGFILLRSKSLDFSVRCFLLIGALAVILGISLNLNRSGWLGLAAIATLLFYERSLRAALIFAIIGGAVATAVNMWFDLTPVQDRLMATRQGLTSDVLRWQLIASAFQIGCENPLLGVSPQGLALDLGARLGSPGMAIETHNIFMHVFAGSGVVCLFLMFYCGYVMWQRRMPRYLPPTRASKFRESRRLLRYLLIVWLLRGFFSHEILYSPAFCMALGLCLGLCLLPTGRLTLRPRPVRRRLKRRHADLIGVG